MSLNPHASGHTAENDVGPNGLVGLRFHRSLSDWSEAEDGSDIRDYGWSLMLYLRGRHRARWSSTKGTTRMWPHIGKGADENCNRSTTFHCWPLGHLDVWWEPNWRTDADGPCGECQAFDTRPIPPAKGEVR